MKITFLGTGAADWQKEDRKKSDFFRRNSSLLVDDTLLIDPGEYVPEALKEFRKNPDKIKHIICTHNHSDHFCEETVKKLKNATFVETHAGETKKIGKYTVTALHANHSLKNAVHFIISDGEKRLFYGLDGAWLMYEEVEAIKEKGVDFAVFDATVGNIPGDYRIFEHNNLSMVLEMKKSLEKHIKRFCISHMAKTLHKTSHKVLSRNMKKHGIEVAFDGYETEI